MTDRYRWLGPEPTRPAVALVAQAPYHLGELDRLAVELAARSVSSGVLIPVPKWKPAHSIRPTVRRLRRTVAASGRRPGPVQSVDQLLARCSSVVVMNDWGVPRHLVVEARTAGVPTYGWVEGVQDYDDVDTGLHRSAYRTVDHVFALGPASAERLGAERSTAVGSERIRALWDRPADPAEHDEVLINSNFTYGVMADARRQWVDGVVEAAQRGGRPWVLSRHVAERGRAGHPVSKRPVASLLDDAGWLVSRFSTVALDALALGVELAYHNPHGERVDTFHEGGDAFATTGSVDELVGVLARPHRSRAEVRDAAAAFVGRHVLLDGAAPPAAIAADVVATGLR